jgi:hypothetical protein
MSLLGFDTVGTATINGLTEINANNVFSDVLYYDADTVPVNVKTAIEGISVDVSALEADVLTLQGEMITAYSNISTLNGEVNTLQSEMNTAQSDINDLQSDMNTAQADITALYVVTGTNTAAIAGLSVSQAAQDVTIAANSAAITVLQGEVSTAEANILTLQVKTTDQSWSSLTGTTFSGRLNVGTTGAGIVLNQASTSTFGSAITIGSGSGVTLNTASASVFNSAINTTRVEALGATSSLVIGDNQTSGFMNIGCNTNRTGGGINIGGGTSNASPTYINAFTGNNALVTIGSNTATGQTVSIRGANVTVGSTNTTSLAFVAAPASNVFFSRNATGGALTFGNDTGTASTNALNFNIGSANTGAINFGTGASAKTITFGNTAATLSLRGTTTIAGTTNINTTTLNNTTIGNGPAGGNITLNGAINAITGTTNINSTGTYGTTIGNTSGTLTLNSGILDINANNGITIDGGSTTTITSINDLTLQTSNPFGDILVSSAGTTTLTSVGETEINSAVLDINASGAITIDGTSTTTLTSTGQTQINSAALDINATGAITIDGSTTTTLTSVGETEINSAALDINATGAITIDGSTTTNITSVGDLTIETTGVTGDITLTSAAGTTIGSVGPISLTTSTDTLYLSSTVGGINIEANGSVEIKSTNNFIAIDSGPTHNVNISAGATIKNDCVAFDVNATGALTIDALTYTMNTTALTGTAMTWQSNTTGSDLILTNPTAGAFSIEAGSGEDLIFKSTGVGDVVFESSDNVFMDAAALVDITATTTATFKSTTADVNITAGTTMDLYAPTSITIDGGPNITNQSSNTIYNQISGLDRLTIQDATVTSNPTTTIDNKINGTSKQTITSTLITNSVPTVNSGLTYPISTTTAIGYTLTTTTTTKGTVANINLASLAIPGAGCYLVEACFMWSGTGTAQTYSAIGLSTTSATFDNKRQQVSYQGGAAGGYGNQITSIFNFTGASTVYFVMQVPTAVGGATNQNNYLAFTRIA